MQRRLRTGEDFDALREEFDTITNKLSKEDELVVRQVVVMANKAGKMSMAMALLKFFGKLILIVTIVSLIRYWFHF